MIMKVILRPVDIQLSIQDLGACPVASFRLLPVRTKKSTGSVPVLLLLDHEYSFALLCMNAAKSNVSAGSSQRAKTGFLQPTLCRKDQLPLVSGIINWRPQVQRQKAREYWNPATKRKPQQGQQPASQFARSP